MNSLFTFSYGSNTIHAIRKVDLVESTKKKFLVFTFDKLNFESFLNKIDSQNIVKTIYLIVTDFSEFHNFFQNFFKPIKAAGGVVRNEKGEILMIYRKKKWDLPKGKIEKNETFKDGAKREVEEETGVKITEVSNLVFKTTFHIYKESNKFYLKENIWYLMLSNSKDKLIPQKEEDIEKVEWTPPNRLKVLLENSYPSIKIVLKLYQKLYC